MDVEVIAGTDSKSATTVMLRGGEDSDVRVKILNSDQNVPCGFVFIIDSEHTNALADALEYASLVLRYQVNQEARS